MTRKQDLEAQLQEMGVTYADDAKLADLERLVYDARRRITVTRPATPEEPAEAAADESGK